MRLRSMTGWLPLWVVAALALAAGGSARADVCVVINPVLDIGCRDVQGAPAGGEPTASSEPAGAPREPEPATRSSTVVRYDPNRVAVTFKPGVTRARVAAVISDAGGTGVQAIPEINAYRGGVEPGQAGGGVGSRAPSAGVIAARSNNHVGGAGVCWRCLVMPIKALDSKGSGDDTLIAAGIVWAVDHGAQVINLSLGGPGSSVELANALAYASAKGVVVLAAAGNAGVTTQFYPAADPQVVSVAATTVADNRYSWSNFGSWVRLAAPGCNIAPILGDGYGTFCGTSSATPVVAGLVA